MKDMNCTNETIFLIIALLFAGVFIVLRHLYAERHQRTVEIFRFCGLLGGQAFLTDCGQIFTGCAGT